MEITAIAYNSEMPQGGISKGSIPHVAKKQYLLPFKFIGGEGFALQRLPIEYAEGAIACSYKQKTLKKDNLAEREGFEPSVRF